MPANPPLPMPCSLPFQPASGIHTSILISESAVGLAMTTTRQNAGTPLYGAVRSRLPEGPGGPANPPASTTSAKMVVAPEIFDSISGLQEFSARTTRLEASRKTASSVAEPSDIAQRRHALFITVPIICMAEILLRPRFSHEDCLMRLHLLPTFHRQVDPVSGIVRGKRNVVAIFLRQVEMVDSIVGGIVWRRQIVIAFHHQYLQVRIFHDGLPHRRRSIRKSLNRRSPIPLVKAGVLRPHVVGHVGLVSQFGADVVVEHRRKRRLRCRTSGIVERSVEQAVGIRPGVARVEP